MPARTSVRPELLAPAGDWDALRAAVLNGADSVYFGLDQFNARHRAANFTLEELPKLIDYIHAHNVRGFLTFNTLIFSDELPEAERYLRAVAAAGVDAVIVQDLGIARMIHQLAPALPIHGSTQMTLTEPRGVKMIGDLGVSRVVLARELSLEEISRIAKATSIPVEVFAHGALCMAYSGQCLTSESIGGRSANRGQCAQACRLPYELHVDGQHRDLGDKAYLLSPKDLAAYDLIADLRDAGAISLKIEGRLKSAHYVAATVRAYRQAIDALDQPNAAPVTQEQIYDLQQTFSRGFSPGFLRGVNHQQLVEGRFPKSRGTKVGTIEKIDRDALIIRLDPALASTGTNATTALKPGDGIVVDEGHPDQDEQGGRVFTITPAGRDTIRITLGRGDLNMAAITPGALIWKTDDPAMKRRLENTFSRDAVARRIPITIALRAHVGEPLRIELRDADQTAIAESLTPLEPARNQPITHAIALEQCSRLGDTPFELATLTLDAAGDPMVPKSLLNDLRRQAAAALIAKRQQTHAVAPDPVLPAMRNAITHKPSQNIGEAPMPRAQLTLLVRTDDQLNAVLAADPALRPSMLYADFEDVRRYKDAVTQCRAANRPLALATLRIIKPHEEGLLQQILDCQPDAILIRNLAALSFFHEKAQSLRLIGDYALNISNELTADYFLNHHLDRIVPSYDLNWKQLQAMLQFIDPARCEIVIHQHMPMFHMEHCIFAHTLSTGTDFKTCGRPCERHAVDLVDRVGEAHPLIPDVGCRNTLFNAQAQSAAEFLPMMQQIGLQHFRIELLRENAPQTLELLRTYHDLLTPQENLQAAGPQSRGTIDATSQLHRPIRSTPRTTARSLKVLAGFGVTRGTLDHE